VKKFGYSSACVQLLAYARADVSTPACGQARAAQSDCSS
jgi:hypothetical protein